jgi:very-short-patch-repair endonuclease
MFGSHAMTDRQRQFAQRMRAQPTDAERVLWQRLRHDIALAGSHFRRQALIGPFIVDFASLKAKIVIELDGGQHNWQQQSDTLRQRQIEAAGYRVLRFWNNDVLGNLEGVLNEIQSALTPTPDPRERASLASDPARGRGEATAPPSPAAPSAQRAQLMPELFSEERFRSPLHPSPLRGGVGGGGPQAMTDMIGPHAMAGDPRASFARLDPSRGAEK